jgi:hypothetical protein
MICKAMSRAASHRRLMTFLWRKAETEAASHRRAPLQEPKVEESNYILMRGEWLPAQDALYRALNWRERKIGRVM